MSSQNAGTAQKTILRNFQVGWLGHPDSVENFPQGLQHVLVPQAVDKRVQHGDHRCVTRSHHPALLQGPAGVISQTREGEGPKEERHQREVGGSGGEGLGAASHGGNPQNGHDGKQAGHQSRRQAGREDENGKHNDYRCLGRAVPTRPL